MNEEEESLDMNEAEQLMDFAYRRILHSHTIERDELDNRCAAICSFFEGYFKERGMVGAHTCIRRRKKRRDEDE